MRPEIAQIRRLDFVREIYLFGYISRSLGSIDRLARQRFYVFMLNPMIFLEILDDDY